MKAFSKILLICLTHLALVAFVSCKKDPCDDVSCLNGGTCMNGTCSCAPGYEGSDCSTLQRTKFLGGYTVNESCDSGIYNYDFFIEASTAGVTRVLLTNFGAVDGSTVSASVSGTTLNIAQQSFMVGGQNWGIVGTGQLNGTTLTMTYTLTFPDNTTDGCTSTCTKQ